MQAQEYPVEHFRLMTRLAEDLRSLPAQIEEHEYSYSTFGSWCTTVRRRGHLFRIIFDGKELEVRLDREIKGFKTEQSEDLCALPTTGQDLPVVITEIVARLRAV